MAITAILGAIGTLIGLVRALPQLFKIIRSHQAQGVSVDTTAVSSVVSFGWAAYGLMTGQSYVSFATGSSGLIFAIITILALRAGHSVSEFRIAPLWLGVLVLVGLICGAQGLGLSLALSALAANLPQLRTALRETDLTGVSAGTWLLSMADGFVWGIYAFIQLDISIIISGLLQFSTSSLIVGQKLFARTKQPEPEVS